jgi:hypothetical protein
MPAPDLELGARPKPAARPSKPKVQEEEVSLELAVDPRELVQQRAAASAAPAPLAHAPAPLARGAHGAPPPPPPSPNALARRPHHSVPAPSDLETDAIVLADYGEAPAYMQALEQLSRADDMLRSRDRVLGAEQDAQKSRLQQVDARISKAEADLAAAQAPERGVAGELASSQGSLARAEAKQKKAEGELKSLIQSMEKRGHGGTG